MKRVSVESRRETALETSSETLEAHQKPNSEQQSPKALPLQENPTPGPQSPFGLAMMVADGAAVCEVRVDDVAAGIEDARDSSGAGRGWRCR